MMEKARNGADGMPTTGPKKAPRASTTSRVLGTATLTAALAATAACSKTDEYQAPSIKAVPTTEAEVRTPAPVETTDTPDPEPIPTVREEQKAPKNSQGAPGEELVSPESFKSKYTMTGALDELKAVCEDVNMRNTPAFAGIISGDQVWVIDCVRNEVDKVLDACDSKYLKTNPNVTGARCRERDGNKTVCVDSHIEEDGKEIPTTFCADTSYTKQSQPLNSYWNGENMKVDQYDKDTKGVFEADAIVVNFQPKGGARVASTPRGGNQPRGFVAPTVSPDGPTAYDILQDQKLKALGRRADVADDERSGMKIQIEDTRATVARLRQQRSRVKAAVAGAKRHEEGK